MELEVAGASDDDFMEKEDEELAAEGARILAQIQDVPQDAAANEEEKEGAAAEDGNEIARVRKLGYNVDDYEIETVEFENCVHESVYPRGYDRRPNFKRPKVKAKTYEFTLDKFQDRAVMCIEKDESVLVAAHTSAGKTAIAEYAIAKSLKGQ